MTSRSGDGADVGAELFAQPDAAPVSVPRSRLPLEHRTPLPPAEPGPGQLPVAVRAVQAAGLVLTAAAPLAGAARTALLAAGTLLVPGGTAVLLAVTARRHGPLRPPASGWLVIAAAQAALSLTAAGALLGGAAGRVAAAAAIVLAACAIATLAAIWPLLRAPTPRWLPSTGWDGATVALGAAAVADLALAAAAGAGRSLPAGPAAGAAALAVPAAGCVLVIGVLTCMSVASAQPRPRLHRLAAGFGAVAAADLAALAATGRPALLVPAGPGAWTRMLALAGYLLVGLAATDLPGGRRAERRRPPRGRRAALPDLALLAAPPILLAGLLLPGMPRTAAALALGCLLAGLMRSRTALSDLRRLGRPDGRPRTDDLTGLANRRALAEALAGTPGPDPAAEAGSEWAGWSGDIALLLVDLDRFKDVNEGLGHEAGDRLLAAVGTRLRGVLRPSQLLARLGGDEFAVVLPAAGAEQGRRVAEALRDSLAEPFEIGGERLHVTASVGIATCSPARGEPTDLLRQADVAMYRAKATGSGSELYDPALDQGSSRLRRIDELREAVDRGDLEVHLQPQVDLHTGEICGAEALARWRHPSDGVLLPDSFLPLAVETGLMRPMAAVLMDSALEACATWWAAGHRVPVSVNVGADDLRDPELTQRVQAALMMHGLPPDALLVEITEQALLVDPAAAAAVLARWRTDGVQVSIDDFGTGYSSLSYLRELPVDEVKLDRAFVADIHRGTTATIVRHTTAMAHGLRARVVAEGIEDEETARVVTDLGADVGQGLYFGGPVVAAEFVTLLATRRRY